MQTQKQTLAAKAATLPDLVWAALILSGTTIILFIWFALSPGILAALERPKDDFTLYASKPSPFTPIVDESVQTRRHAARAVPILAAEDRVETPEGTPVIHDSSAVPAYYSPEEQGTGSGDTVRGAQVYDVLERESEMPRISAALHESAESGNTLAR